jgi:signal transduction histidine kinase
LLNSFSFRLALVYALLFTVSVSVLLALYYWSAIYRPMEAVRAGIRHETAQVAETYRAQGPAAAARLLEARAARAAARRPYHTLIAPGGRVLSTNLPSWPAGTDTASQPAGENPNWMRIEADIYRDGEEDDHEALMLDERLPDGARLMVGRDIDDLDDIEETILDAAIWLPAVILLLVIGGGALMSRAIGRRLEAVTGAARQVMGGDLSQRIEVRGTSDDFDRLGETLNLMLARIEASLEAVRRVSDSVAHELRTPLARLQATMHELEADPARNQAMLGEAVAEVDRLQGIFEAVLRIARIEAARYAGETTPVDLSALLADAAEYYQPEAEARGQSLSTTIAPGLCTAGDRDLLFQAVLNLLDNAVKYAPHGGRIALAVAGEGEAILLSVTDDGPGIPPELHDKVTERFFRAPGAAGEPGAGLGLALVSAVAAYHGSRLEFADAAPGLRVEWRLPAAKFQSHPGAGRDP